MNTVKKSRDILGKVVVNDEGLIIGEVNDYLVDIEQWQITDIQIKIEKNVAKELGLKTPFFGSLLVLLDINQIRATTDQILIDLGRDEFCNYVEQRQQDEKDAEKQAKKDAKAKKKNKGDDDDSDDNQEEEEVQESEENQD